MIKDFPAFQRLSAFLVHHEVDFSRVGSSKIKGVEHPGDYDILVLERDGLVKEYLIRDDKDGEWAVGGSSLPENSFTSYRDTSSALITDPVVNVILAHSKEFYDKFIIAQKICEEANIAVKSYRIMVFDYIMDRDGKCSEEDFVSLCKRGHPRHLDVPF